MTPPVGMTKERVVERKGPLSRDRAVAGGGDAFSIDSNRFNEFKKSHRLSG
jgi:hypothetical protein